VLSRPENPKWRGTLRARRRTHVVTEQGSAPLSPPRRSTACRIQHYSLAPASDPALAPTPTGQGCRSSRASEWRRCLGRHCAGYLSTGRRSHRPSCLPTPSQPAPEPNEDCPARERGRSWLRRDTSHRPCRGRRAHPCRARPGDDAAASDPSGAAARLRDGNSCSADAAKPWRPPRTAQWNAPGYR
jgi:hypothetical protein